MKNLITRLALVLFIVSSLGAWAQGGCNGAIKLNDLKNYCSGPKAYNNNTANFTSANNLGGCYSTSNLKNEVWFKFTAIGSEVNFTVKTNGADGTIKNPNLTLHETCTGSPLACTKGSTTNQNVLYFSGATTGKEYYIRVITTSGDAGTFAICIDNKTPPPNAQADCDKSVKLCDKSPVHIDGLSGTGVKNQEIDWGENGCFTMETNSCWYYWKCSKSGVLTFNISPNDGKSDMDFMLYSADAQEDLCYSFGSGKPNKRTLERCSATNCDTNNRVTGLKIGATDVKEDGGCDTKNDGFVKEVNMVAGKWYELFIVNANTKEGFSINFGNEPNSGEFEGPTAKIHADKVTICEGNTIKFESTSAGYDTGKLEWIFTGGNPSTYTDEGPVDVRYDTPGNYVAIIKATSGKCVQTDYLNITVNAGATVSVESKEVCEKGNVTLKAIPTIPGGVFKWTPGPPTGSKADSTLTVSPSTTQTYTVTYSLAGCDAEALGVVTVNKNPEVNVNSENVCPGSPVDLKATVTETGSKPTFQWSTGETKQIITVSPTVKTTYTVIATSEEGCKDTASGTVDINGRLKVLLKDTIACKDGTVQLLANPNGAGYTYKWTASNGTVISDPAIYNPTAVVSTATTFSVSIVSDKGCVGDSSMTVSIDPAMSASLTLSPVSCGACDGKITATVSGGTTPYNYSWTDGCDKAACTELCQGAYTLTVTDKIGCIITKDTTLVAPPNFTAQTSIVQSICGLSNGSATVVATGGGGNFKYEWNDKDKQDQATATNLPAGKYCVTVSDANNCKKIECVDIIDRPGFTATISAVTKTSCFGVCDGTAEVAVTGAYGPVSYSWNTNPNSQTSVKATGLCAEDYIVTIKDSVGCKDTLHVKIEQPTKVVLDPLPVVKLCIGSSATLNAVAHGGSGNYKYIWTELPDTTASVSVSPTVSTDYHVSVRDGNGCVSDPLTIKVVVNPALQVTVSGKTKLCLGDSTKLTAVGSGGNSGPYTYTWAPAIATLSSSVTITPKTTQTYTVTVKDECGTPAATDTIRVVVNAIPEIKFTADTTQGCDPLEVTFNADSTKVQGGSIDDWKWDFGDGAKSDSKNPTHLFESKDGKTTVYSVRLTVKSSSSINGCGSTVIKKDYIRVFPVPDANFEVPVSTSIVNPTVHFINTSVRATSWDWDFGDSLSSPVNNVSTIYSPDHIYSEIGEYCVRLIAKNYGGCSDTTIRCIKIDPKFVLYIPNAFTPNGDDDNDVFFAKGEYITEFEMRIFDRWGMMVFYSDSIDRGWNGKINNTSAELCPNDVYVYQIRIKDNLNKGHKYVGKVTMLKGR